MKFDTIEEAAREWVSGFNAIPIGIAEKLLQANEEELVEITPPSKCDRVYIYDGAYDQKRGEIVGRDEDDDEVYLILLDDTHETVRVSRDDFEVDREGVLPMWGTLWSFGEQIDNDWLSGKYLDEDALQKMADCGFRIYEQEDYEYIFGIDGAGYSFMEAHWIPLYKARGLHWHKEEEIA